MINNKVFREILKFFNIHLLADWFLRSFPRQGKFGNSKYRVASLEAYLVEKEIFKVGIYDGIFELANVTTFADLGSNRGFFCAWLNGKTRVQPKGILLEANPALISNIEGLLKDN